MMPSLPVERALSTTFFISQGERNCPFLMLTGLPWLAVLTMKLVCRHRKAGVCRTSTTAATSAQRRVFVHIGEHRHTHSAPHVLEDLQACVDARSAIARARGSVRLVVGSLEDVRNAQTARDLLQPTRNLLRQCGTLDDAGTGDQEERTADPDLVSREFHGSDQPLRRRCLRQLRGSMRARRADESGEQRVAITRSRGELRVELRGDEPRMVRQLDHLHEAVTREAREAQPRLA